jgi:AraC-like DNA-binding protein
MRQRSAFVGRGNTSNVGNPDWEESSSEQDLVLGETVSFKMVEHVPPPSPDLVDKIRLFMKERKPHLDPEITLSAMANELGIGRNTLSYAINSGFKMNFFTFINNHRVEEVIAMLDDPDKKDENLLRIGYDAGFNSKATFNHIFKKYTGFTPKEYKLGKKGTNPDV